MTMIQRIAQAMRNSKAWPAVFGAGIAEELARVAVAQIPQWRPIETAPKETRVLALVDGEVRFCCWGKTSHVPIYGWNLADQGAEDCELCEPTHWMPLPEPPETT